MKIPTFTTPRLILKEVSLDDAESYQKYFNDYEVIGHLTARVPWPYPEGGAADFIKHVVLPHMGNNYWMWGIFLKDNPHELIGAIDFFRGSAENRGFWLGRPFWGRGIMTEALEPLTGFAFSDLGFDVLKLGNALGNQKSRRLKEKQGARFIGLRSAQFVNPDYKQSEDWELTKEAWLNSQAPR